MKKLVFSILFSFLSLFSFAQSGPDEDQLGAWYMYFFNKSFNNSQFGIQGDVQFRLWSPVSDLEQLLLRSGITYTPENADILFTLGYANITTGVFGESDETVMENRIYQEALFPTKVGRRFLFTHRFRYEQRWVDTQDLRTRYRYNLFLNVPLNGSALEKGVVYLAMYNEIFLNGQRDIGEGRTVEVFDRNRLYLGAGYGFLSNLRVQGGWMLQTTDSWSKGQLQFSLHHKL
ncbi:DUF2490 domain-containing protein [Algoriphagus chordae]|uniref:Uncharacterized protein DUF2490 n=1 Tax=Algoriphagus chordae TaxID=237019 RepID=A0A2W7QMC3_9BACT|nr:DUF2490 domain-containing protein [Algoriphagus chordae]PZX48436.1 uncharacterized protein DUF2490 [Algoriphagus chordae]